jgi:hypothetical protein
MNTIKEFYIKHNKNRTCLQMEIETSHPQQTEQHREPMAFEVALLSAITSAASVYFLLRLWGILNGGDG